MDYKSRRWVTMDNGGNPFIVYERYKENETPYLEVFLNPDDDDYYDYDANGEQLPVQAVFDRPIFTTRFQRIFIGRDPYMWSDEWLAEYEGNSIVVQDVEGKLYYIGECIFSFELAEGDELTDEAIYTSLMGNNWVPYPALITEHNLYLLIEDAVIPRDAIPLGIDPYQVYYGYMLPDGSKPGDVYSDAADEARHREFVKQHNVRPFKRNDVWERFQRR